MTVSWKNCLRVAASAFLLFLCIHYCDSVLRFIGVVVGAAAPLITGLVIAYILNILMDFYERHYFTKWTDKKIVNSTRRVVCMLAALISGVGIVALVIILVIPELVSCISFIIAEIPPLIQSLLNSEWVSEIIPDDTIKNLSAINWQEYLTKGIEMLTSGIGSALGTIISAVTSVVSAVVQAFIGVIFAIYLLLSKDTLKAQSSKILNRYLKPEWKMKFMYSVSVLNDSFRRFIVGQCTEAVILGILCMLGMFALQIPYAIMIGTLIGFTALIPVAGAYIGAAVGAIMILTESPIKALIFLIFLVILQNLEGNLIYPKVVGTSIGLPAIWVLAAVTIGGGVLGVTGMLIGVPLTAAIYRLICEDISGKSTPLSRPIKERNEK